jgi:hypothetical protein
MVLKIKIVAFANAKYMICNTHIAPNGSMVHTLQDLVTNMS